MFRIGRLATVGGLAAVAIGLAATPALAHVSVVSTDATQGGFGQITFRVPSESSTASTTKLTVQLPADQPLATVSVRPIPGWTHKETTQKLATPLKDDDGNEITEAVSTVEWTASSPDAAIKPGEYAEFSISAGPLPKAATMTFKAIQTYSDNSTVAWIEQAASGGAEPEHPAPTLTLLPAAATSSAPAPSAAAAAADSSSGSSGTATTALVLGILGLLAGLVGIGVAVSSRRGGGVPEPDRTDAVPASRD